MRAQNHPLIVTLFSFQHHPLSTYICQKDERALPGKLQSRNSNSFLIPYNKCGNASHYRSFFLFLPFRHRFT